MKVLNIISRGNATNLIGFNKLGNFTDKEFCDDKKNKKKCTPKIPKGFYAVGFKSHDGPESDMGDGNSTDSAPAPTGSEG